MSATTTIAQVNPRRRTAGRSVQITRLLPRPLLVVANVLLCLLVLGPVSYMVFASVNSDIAVAAGEYWPQDLRLENYLTVWRTIDLGAGLVNSLLICGAVAIVCAAVAVSIAWVLVRFTFVGRVTILRGLLGLQSVPGTLMLLPVFVMFSTLSAILRVPTIGTHWSVFVTYLTFALPFSTWVMVTYIRGLPRELEEAARMDGASNFRVLTRIVLPLSWPGIVVSAIFAFLQGWNDVLFASVMTNRESRTAAVALQIFGATQETGAVPLYGQMMAASLICAAPVVVLYLVFQRYLVGGLTAGGVK
ncbi:multiple sugar transport system permease protein [Microbacterium resistens]|uniref:Multiple sugar transport system permease protein n=1 Tax=Microbacterium resistens TaxID=156977 RepID=A0ABU1SC22_9MICO|nr:carbohydrate ABC transporter permease [Microbacterium resistens]MDR6867109.1 multiple sugar transport system permease protein [Microbacterium resistens]